MGILGEDGDWTGVANEVVKTIRLHSRLKELIDELRNEGCNSLEIEHLINTETTSILIGHRIQKRRLEREKLEQMK